MSDTLAEQRVTALRSGTPEGWVGELKFLEDYLVWKNAGGQKAYEAKLERELGERINAAIKSENPGSLIGSVTTPASHL